MVTFNQLDTHSICNETDRHAARANREMCEASDGLLADRGAAFPSTYFRSFGPIVAHDSICDVCGTYNGAADDRMVDACNECGGTVTRLLPYSHQPLRDMDLSGALALDVDGRVIARNRRGWDGTVQLQTLPVLRTPTGLYWAHDERCLVCPLTGNRVAPGTVGEPYAEDGLTVSGECWPGDQNVYRSARLNGAVVGCGGACRVVHRVGGRSVWMHPLDIEAEGLRTLDCGHTIGEDETDHDGRCDECQQSYVRDLRARDRNPLASYHGARGESLGFFRSPGEPTVAARPTRYYGVEVEVELADGSSCGRHCDGSCSSYNEDTDGHESDPDCEGCADDDDDDSGRNELACEKWPHFKPRCVFTTDSSLESGWEIVSAPMTLQAHRDFWLALPKQAFRGLIGHDTETAGIHVHVSRNSLSSLTLQKLCHFMYEPANQALVTTTAQRKPNDYCLRKGLHQSNGVGFYRTRDGSRYNAVNVTNNHTIEIRVFKGNTRTERIVKNIEAVDSWIAFCEETSVQELFAHNYLEYVAAHRGRWPALVSYLTDRGLLVRKHAPAPGALPIHDDA